MISENSCTYGFERHLQRATFEEALEKVTAALKRLRRVMASLASIP